MNLLLISLYLFLSPVEVTENTIDLTGKWTITGKTQYGYLDFDWQIIDYDDEIAITKLSRQGYNDMDQEVTYYSQSHNKVVIKTFEDVGIMQIPRLSGTASLTWARLAIVGLIIKF